MLKTKIVRVGLYEKPFVAQLATEDTCAVGVAYIAIFVESFMENMLVAFESEE